MGRFKYLKDGTKIRRWSCGTATREGTAGCNVGKVVRDDDALHMLKTAILNLSMDYDAVIRNVTELAMESILAENSAACEDSHRLRQELKRVQQKKETVMDAYFSREISKEDMQLMKERYEQRLSDLDKRLEAVQKRKNTKEEIASLHAHIHAEVSAILLGKKESEVFYKTLLHSLTVFKDRHMELTLNMLPMVFHFTD